jgi:hypothetical protein
MCTTTCYIIVDHNIEFTKSKLPWIFFFGGFLEETNIKLKYFLKGMSEVAQDDLWPKFRLLKAF